jgi:2-phosphosulfolactate phosphatase
MKFSRVFLNRLNDQPDIHDTVIVVDVLRSFTTAAVALANGATAVYPVESLAAASQLASRIERSVSVGAMAGGNPAPGFDFGNSPSELMRANLAGRTIVISTAAGVRALHRFRNARSLYAASLVCARATADAIRAEGAKEVCFVITGEWVDRDGDEDISCADYIESLLTGDLVAPEFFSKRVRESDFGRRFMASNSPSLPIADLELAADVDYFKFSMPVLREGEHLVIRR